jgi:hypothetical protein
MTMPSRANVLVTVGVAAVAIAAVASSLLRSDAAQRPDAAATVATEPEQKPPRPAEPASQQDAELAAAARALEDYGLRGVLGVIDEECEFRALALPDLAPARADGPTRCSFPVSPGEPRPSGHPGFRIPTAPELRCRLALCEYAWKPEGIATYVRAGEVAELRSGCGDRMTPCPRVVLSRQDLAAAFGVVMSPHVRQLAWLSDERLLAIVRTGAVGARRDVVAVFQGRRLVAHVRLPARRLSLIRMSPSRRVAAVRADSGAPLWLLRVRGSSLTARAFPPWSPPAPTELRAIAWSPDDRWTALATRRAVYLFRTSRPEAGFVGIPVVARDVRLS